MRLCCPSVFSLHSHHSQQVGLCRVVQASTLRTQQTNLGCECVVYPSLVKREHVQCLLFDGFRNSHKSKGVDSMDRRTNHLLPSLDFSMYVLFLYSDRCESSMRTRKKTSRNLEYRKRSVFWVLLVQDTPRTWRPSQYLSNHLLITLQGSVWK
jgi:hypothetical protein